MVSSNLNNGLLGFGHSNSIIFLIVPGRSFGQQLRSFGSMTTQEKMIVSYHVRGTIGAAVGTMR